MQHTEQYQLELIARNRPELAERVLRVVRHRGFSLNSFELCERGDQLQLQLLVTSERPLHLLTSQLEKLLDVQELRQLQLSVEALRA